MDASASADGVAARLEALQEQCACWTLESDRQLLHVLQEMSQELLASLDGCRAAADSVSSEAGAAAVRVAATASQFRLLSLTRFIQQVRCCEAAPGVCVGLQERCFICWAVKAQQ